MVSTCDLQSLQDMCNRKLRIASALFPLPQDPPSSVETAETFHTAAADSPELRSLFPETAAFLTRKTETELVPECKEKSPVNENREEAICVECEIEEKITTKTEETTSKLEDKPSSNINNIRESESPIEYRTRDSQCDGDSENGDFFRHREDSQETLSLGEEGMLRENQMMKRLNQRVARQRMHVMRCLEASTPSKEDLNRQISILQDLQKQQIELEVALLEKERVNQRDQSEEERMSGLDASADYSKCEYGEDALEWNARLIAHSYATPLVSNVRQEFALRGARSDPDEEGPSNRPITSTTSPTRGYSSVYLTVRNSRN